jgi:soluble lytic murein transglycosylase-like protein
VARSSRRRTSAQGSRRTRGSRWLRRAAFAAGFLALAWIGWRFAAGAFLSAAESVRYRSHVQRVESHAEAIRAAALESRVDPNLLAAIMLAESGGRVDAVSSAGALGLYQLMLPTAIEQARALGLEDPTESDLLGDAELNARLAARYLAWLERRYEGALEPMLIAYNAGPGRLARWIRDAGGYPAWRAERDAAGNSDVLRYAAKVEHWRAVFRERGVVAPPCDQPPAPRESEIELEPPYGPPADEHATGSTSDEGSAGGP